MNRLLCLFLFQSENISGRCFKALLFAIREQYNWPNYRVAFKLKPKEKKIRKKLATGLSDYISPTRCNKSASLNYDSSQCFFTEKRCFVFTLIAQGKTTCSSCIVSNAAVFSTFHSCRFLLCNLCYCVTRYKNSRRKVPSRFVTDIIIYIKDTQRSAEKDFTEN